MQTKITLTITHTKPIADLADKVASRAYTLDGVDDVQDLSALPTWQPIESAPKHTEVLGYRNGKIANAQQVSRDDCEMWAFGSLCADIEICPAAKPTYWTPLPTPPAEAA